MFDSVNDLCGIQLIRDKIPDSRLIVIYSSLSRYKLTRKHYVELLDSLFQLNCAVAFPAFTYSSRRGNIYSPSLMPDPQNGALSRVAFSEYPGEFLRTADVDYSYIIFNSKHLTINVESLLVNSKRSFGTNSHHSAFFNLNPLLVALGEGFRDGFTPSMQVEALVNTQNREYIRTLAIEENGVTFEREYFARIQWNNSNPIKPNRIRLESILECDATYFKHVNKMGGSTVGINASSFLKILKKYLLEDRNFFYEE